MAPVSHAADIAAAYREQPEYREPPVTPRHVEDDPPLCDHCRAEITEDDDEVRGDDYVYHHACWVQIEAADDLREALNSCARDLKDKLEEYRWERRFGSARKSPELPEAECLVRRVEAILNLMTNRPLGLR